VYFDLVREAGTLHLEGNLGNGSGQGNFTFVPNPGFAAEMRSLRVQGVTPEYIRRIRSMGHGNPSLDQIVNLRVQGIVE
jgi:hypothetical protein